MNLKSTVVLWPCDIRSNSVAHLSIDPPPKVSPQCGIILCVSTMRHYYPENTRLHLFPSRERSRHIEDLRKRMIQKKGGGAHFFQKYLKFSVVNLQIPLLGNSSVVEFPRCFCWLLTDQWQIRYQWAGPLGRVALGMNGATGSILPTHLTATLGHFLYLTTNATPRRCAPLAGEA